MTELLAASECVVPRLADLAAELDADGAVADGELGAHYLGHEVRAKEERSSLLSAAFT